MIGIGAFWAILVGLVAVGGLLVWTVLLASSGRLEAEWIVPPTLVFLFLLAMLHVVSP